MSIVVSCICGKIHTHEQASELLNKMEEEVKTDESTEPKVEESKTEESATVTPTLKRLEVTHFAVEENENKEFLTTIDWQLFNKADNSLMDSGEWTEPKAMVEDELLEYAKSKVDDADVLTIEVVLNLVP